MFEFDINNSSFADLTSTGLPSYAARMENLPNFPALSLEKGDFAMIYTFIADFCTFSTLWKLVLFGLVMANFKNFPMVYHLRLLNAVRFVLRSQRSAAGPTPEHLFQPIITSSKASLLETDCYLHKSNSTYFSDVDVARAHLITTLFSKGIEKIRGGTTAIVNGKVPGFGVALGAVSCTFRKELKPYETYDMWTRILSWDEKWVYIVTHFIKKGAQVNPREFVLYPRQNSIAGSTTSTPRGSVSTATAGTPRGSISGDPSPATKSAIAASALSKVVFKNGRITIPPNVLFEAAGVLPPRPSTSEEESDEKQAIVGADENALPQKSMQTLDDDDGLDDDDSPSWRGSMWTWQRIEAERQRGLKTAKLLAGLNALENEMFDETSLGRHTDGTGIPGCVATLAQLGHLSNYQLL